MPVDKNSPRDPHLAQQPQAPQQPAAEGTAARPKAQARAPGGRKVRFAAQDEVVAYRPGEGLAGHDLPIPRAAKPPAPAEAKDPRPACAVLTDPDGKRSVLWPNGQRYDGAYDGFGAPHGDGTVRLADGHEHVSRWFHGTCTDVAGDVARAKDVAAYMSPPAKRKRAPLAPRPPSTQGGAGPADDADGGGRKSGGLLGKLKQLGRGKKP